MKQLYKVRISSGLEYEVLGDLELGLKSGDEVILRCERYLDYATVCTAVGEPIEDEEAFEQKRAQQNKGRHVEGQRLPQVMRLATPEDKAQAQENEKAAFEAHNQTMERIKAHNLEMKLIHTHYAFDRKLILFQFSADGRIDFRELLRDLSGLLKVRVELRQVGVRDEALILGGIGNCGRPFCCASFLPNFNSINVKMAKMQGLSLNPQNISGCCGRLKCCLAYEVEAYRELNALQKQKQEEAAKAAAEGVAEASEEAEAAGREGGEVADKAVAEEPMFEDEGTIVKAQTITVAAASTSPENGAPRRRERGNDGRREHPGQGGQGGPQRAAGGGAVRNGMARMAPKPQKKPLPPAGTEGADDSSERPEQRSGERPEQRSGERRRDHDDRRERRERGDRGERRREQGNGERRRGDEGGMPRGGREGNREGVNEGQRNHGAPRQGQGERPTGENGRAFGVESEPRGGEPPAAGGIGEFGN